MYGAGHVRFIDEPGEALTVRSYIALAEVGKKFTTNKDGNRWNCARSGKIGNKRK